LEFALDGETRVLRAGEGASVPPDAAHQAVALEPTSVLDAWYPQREDYRP
jgi:quercetin dioxygenase-like cupin family protein